MLCDSEFSVNFSQMLMRSEWYEKLNDWEKSLQLLNECREGSREGRGKEVSRCVSTSGL